MAERRHASRAFFGLPWGCLSTPLHDGWNFLRVDLDAMLKDDGSELLSRWDPKTFFWGWLWCWTIVGSWRSPQLARLLGLDDNIVNLHLDVAYRQCTPRCCIISRHGSISSHTAGRWRPCCSMKMTLVCNRMSRRQWWARSWVSQTHSI